MRGRIARDDSGHDENGGLRYRARSAAANDAANSGSEPCMTMARQAPPDAVAELALDRGAVRAQAPAAQEQIVEELHGTQARRAAPSDDFYLQARRHDSVAGEGGLQQDSAEAPAVVRR